MQNIQHSVAEQNNTHGHSAEFLLTLAGVSLFGALAFLALNTGILSGDKYKLTAAAGDSASPTGAYYVSVNDGSDSNSGTSVDAPFKTVQKAANLAVAGDTVYIRGGTYREDVRVKNGGSPGNPIKIFAYQNEKPVFKATDVVTGWTNHQGNIWKKDGWGYESQQVFVDFDSNPGPPLEQIRNPLYSSYSVNMGSAQGVSVPNRTLSDIKPGSFYYDPSSGSLYVWLADGSDPNNHVIEVGKRPMNMAPGASSPGYLHIKGLTFRFGNTGTVNYFPIVSAGRGGIIENCDIQWADEVGTHISFGGKLINSTVSNNGLTGVGAQGSGNVISGNRIQKNNYRHYLTSHLGGLKLIPDFGGVIENNTITDNYGSGLWIDTNYVPGSSSGPKVVIRYNFFRGNNRPPAVSPYNQKGGVAIFYEISENADIHDNIIVGDEVRGIYLSNSRNNKVYNNSLVGNNTYDTIGSNSDSRYHYANNVIKNNLIYQPSNSNSMLNFLNGHRISDKAYNNVSDYNLFYAEGRPDSVRIVSNNDTCCGAIWQTLSTWRAFSNQDTHSVNADPNTASSASGASSASDVKLQWNSAAIDAGTLIDGAVRVRDYFGNPIYGAPDIGAAEYQPPYRISSNKPNTSANVRIYSDGKFRNKSSPNGSEASIVFKPFGGYQSNYLQWIDLTINTWTDRKNYKIDVKDIGDNILTTNVGDLKPDAIYTIAVDGTDDNGISGTGYANGVVKTDATGVAAFNYSGTWNTSHTFDIRETPSAVLTPVGDDNPASIVNPPERPQAQADPIDVVTARQNQNNQNPQQPVAINYANTAEILSTNEAVPASTVCKESKWAYKLNKDFRFTKSLEKGDSGEDVKALQYILARENYFDPANINGYFDDATVSGLDKFQKYYGIVVSKIEKMNGYGVLGTRTWQRINQAIARGKYVVNCNAPTATAFVPAPTVRPAVNPVATNPVNTTYVPTYTRAPSVALNTKFTIPLKLGMTSPEVRRLQAFLNSKGFTVATSGEGSYGREGNYFGQSTKVALIRFQEFYAADILAPALLKKGTGYFGALSMKKANQLLGFK